MQLTKEQIRKRVAIENAAEDSYRSISYDVRVGKVVGWKEGKVTTDENGWTIRPQGIVEVISKEKFMMPADVTGYAMVRTRLCNEGILPLNIGIVDPNFNGHLSTTLLNFSKVDYPLNADEVFLRLTFHECDAQVPKDAALADVERNYVNERIKKISRFDETFLNLRSSIEDVATPLFWKYLAVVGVSLAALTFFINLSVAWVGRQLWNNRDDLRAGLINEIRAGTLADPQIVANMRAEINQLRVTNDALRQKLEDIQSQFPKRQTPTRVPAQKAVP